MDKIKNIITNPLPNKHDWERILIRNDWSEVEKAISEYNNKMENKFIRIPEDTIIFAWEHPLKFLYEGHLKKPMINNNKMEDHTNDIDKELERLKEYKKIMEELNKDYTKEWFHTVNNKQCLMETGLILSEKELERYGFFYHGNNESGYMVYINKTIGGKFYTNGKKFYRNKEGFIFRLDSLGDKYVIFKDKNEFIRHCGVENQDGHVLAPKQKTYKITIGDREFTQTESDIQFAFNRFFNNTLEPKSSIKSITIQEYTEQDEMLDKLKSLQAEMDMIITKLNSVENGK